MNENDFPRNLRKKIIKDAQFKKYVDPVEGLVGSIDYLGYNLKLSISNVNTADMDDDIKGSLVDRLLVSTDVINVMVKERNRKRNLKYLLD